MLKKLPSELDGWFLAGLYEFHAGICSCPDSGFTNFMQDIHWAVKKVLVFRESGFWGPVLRKTRTSPPPKSLLTITGRDREKIGVGAGFARTRLYSVGEASQIRQRPGNVGHWPTFPGGRGWFGIFVGPQRRVGDVSVQRWIFWNFRLLVR